ncbi:hypothetical protein KDA_73340 [Dictyobacter alpinus]|uniref:Uncharacterized protein n=1 Tax=Dictyobacter alpinus TaxID=2014873 RepID=A0A402BKK9_9CHLR|nr:hypothetical protein [Dictyobacter alpinus]GCE31850.1 hypothetical protein KDA_73340 [Dictyobacter alpinus]
MIKFMNKGTDTSSSRASRWILWVGYAACAWGIWFATLHALLFFGGGSFDIPNISRWLYILLTTLSVLLFTTAALFPLSLIWPFHWLRKSRLQMITLVLAYIGMLGFTLYELVLAKNEPGAVGFGVGVCVLGVIVAFIRPRKYNIAQWMVLIATWAIGIGMTLYGGAYICLSFFQPTFEQGLSYFSLGGINFTVEGILFVATAWLISRYGQ